MSGSMQFEDVQAESDAQTVDVLWRGSQELLARGDVEQAVRRKEEAAHVLFGVRCLKPTLGDHWRQKDPETVKLRQLLLNPSPEGALLHCLAKAFVQMGLGSLSMCECRWPAQCQGAGFLCYRLLQEMECAEGLRVRRLDATVGCKMLRGMYSCSKTPLAIQAAWENKSKAETDRCMKLLRNDRWMRMAVFLRAEALVTFANSAWRMDPEGRKLQQRCFEAMVALPVELGAEGPGEADDERE